MFVILWILCWVLAIFFLTFDVTSGIVLFAFGLVFLLIQLVFVSKKEKKSTVSSFTPNNSESVSIPVDNTSGEYKDIERTAETENFLSTEDSHSDSIINHASTSSTQSFPPSFTPAETITEHAMRVGDCVFVAENIAMIYWIMEHEPYEYRDNHVSAAIMAAATDAMFALNLFDDDFIENFCAYMYHAVHHCFILIGDPFDRDFLHFSFIAGEITDENFLLTSISKQVCFLLLSRAENRIGDNNFIATRIENDEPNIKNAISEVLRQNTSHLLYPNIRASVSKYYSDEDYRELMERVLSIYRTIEDMEEDDTDVIEESNAQSKDIKLIQANYDELISDCQYELDQSQALNDKYLRKIEELTKQVKNLEERLNNSTQVCNDLASECTQAIEREKQNRQELVLSCHLDKLKESPLFAPETMKRFCGAIKDKRFVNSFDPNISIQSDFNVSCEINSSGTIYKTSLYSCTCEDYLHRKRVCKHMLYLAASCGVIYFFGKSQTEMLNDVRAYAQVSMEHEDEANSLRQKAKEDRQRLKAEKEDLFNKEKILLEKSQTYPWLAELLARYQREVDHYRESLLPNSAWKSAQIVKTMKRERKELKIECELLRNQLNVYESMFPWLEEFKLLSNQEIAQYTSQNTNDEYHSLHNWLSPDEFAKLTNQEKNQLALDRYNKRAKSDWEAGIEYERYIGYLCESKGGTVTYTGARNGLNDLGRDLIVTFENKIYVIQCKRWSSKKQIHEKHIFQLFGTCVLLKIENTVPVIPVFVTTTILSDTAKECAKELNVSVFEQIPLHKYPQIKCNINHSTGEKIYHLPFDQQYDTTMIEKNTGELYVSTVREAEALGFRRAFRHTSAS